MKALGRRMNTASEELKVTVASLCVCVPTKQEKMKLGSIYSAQEKSRV